jgi:hypothetical protein
MEKEISLEKTNPDFLDILKTIKLHMDNFKENKTLNTKDNFSSLNSMELES